MMPHQLPISPASFSSPPSSSSSSSSGAAAADGAPRMLLQKHRAPEAGHESRNDSSASQTPLHWRRPSEPERRSVYRRNHREEEDLDDEIPSLIDEELDSHHSRNHGQTAHSCRDDCQPWQRRQQEVEEEEEPPQEPEQQEREHTQTIRCQSPTSTPQRPPLPRSSSISSCDTDSQRNQVITCNSNEGALPFFVLDWMLDDLVPEDKTAHDLAKLLNESNEGTTASQGHSDASQPLRKSNPRVLIGSGMDNAGRDSNTSSFATVSADLTRSNPSPTILSVSNGPSASPSRSPTVATTASTMPTMPITPKSSNRRACRMRQRAGEDDPVDPEGHYCDCDGNELPFVPRNLTDSFGEASGGIGNITNHSLMPRTNPAPMTPPGDRRPPQRDRHHEKDGSFANAKKSLSCPDFLQDDEEETPSAVSPNRTDSPPNLKLRKRAKEQNDRRERRNKLTIVQRSLTQAQGWNNKGLAMAGTATRAELQEQQQLPHMERLQPQPSTGPNGAGVHRGPGYWWESSLECWDNALEIYRSLLGERHERVADVQNNRGIALGKLGRFEEALEALESALQTRKKHRQRLVEEAGRDAAQNTVIGGAPTSQRGNRGRNNHSQGGTVVTAAMVSTLHNIANVFREAGNSTEALKMLMQAQMVIRDSERELLRSGAGGENSSSFHQHRNQCKHQSARLSVAIGHIYYESERWRDARDHYGDALDIYERLLASLCKQSDRLGWGSSGHPPSASVQSNDDVDETQQRLELLQHRQLLQREIAVLERDLDDLDLSQQARVGSRARLLQARRQQQQQPNQPRFETSLRRVPQQSRQQQQQPNQNRTLLGIVSSLRA
eukprot:CAMPEP_0197181686 /NCGR_PEP_ID=MMETSP1423-20130617/5898_1 /TAXON_ID=476441 /ORGANISM="Pseudo-nitzschia heimii, Strain UNC1101" /LENGTH=836 /DNA_ID=CAMNT_0042631981 /DNA_START=896 /DNA_END=3406 /DNA_ORIENTATION=+